MKTDKRIRCEICKSRYNPKNEVRKLRHENGLCKKKQS
jgi:hypothetical protein